MNDKPEMTTKIVDNVMEITLMFKSGESYCCVEPGCHLGMHTKEERAMFIRGVNKMTSIEEKINVIKVKAIVERGVKLTSCGSCDEVKEEETYETMYDV